MAKEKHKRARLQTTRRVVSCKMFGRASRPHQTNATERGLSARSRVQRSTVFATACALGWSALLRAESPRSISGGHRSVFPSLRCKIVPWRCEIPALRHDFKMLRRVLGLLRLVSPFLRRVFVKRCRVFIQLPCATALLWRRKMK